MTIAIISLGFRHGISLQFAVYLAGQARCHRLPRSFHREPGEPRYRDDPNIYPNVSHESMITSCRAEHFFVRGPLRSIGSHLNTGSPVVDRCRMIERFAPRADRLSIDDSILGRPPRTSRTLDFLKRTRRSCLRYISKSRSQCSIAPFLFRAPRRY